MSSGVPQRSSLHLGLFKIPHEAVLWPVKSSIGYINPSFVVLRLHFYTPLFCSKRPKFTNVPLCLCARLSPKLRRKRECVELKNEFGGVACSLSFSFYILSDGVLKHHNHSMHDRTPVAVQNARRHIFMSTEGLSEKEFVKQLCRLAETDFETPSTLRTSNCSSTSL
jgi:hypothetical protein